jgi:predicted nucleotidyltransferase
LTPTRFAELNDVLEQLVAGARQILGANFVGAYLQGSFAVGDADEHSDVDFLVVTDREVDDREQRELQALHERLFELPTTWAQHLEGSYVPRDELRRTAPTRRRWFYFDNGSVEPAWDEHDDTAVVRVTLRDHGVVLDGPDPRELVDPISPDELRADVRAGLAEFVDWCRQVPRVSRRGQGVRVLTLCRILHTLETGRINTKPAAERWALEALDADWGPLIRRAQRDRPDPWRKVREEADEEYTAQLLSFVDYAETTAATRSGGTPSAAR